ncbi:hypothetical protein SAMN04490248_1811 [Salinihabitans flavidus]|uniref:Uncharacterized protein n=1 Tax=Salinihabitans flavidus TaxID=569882 RepID=A0A1H8WLS9_9RHOB|nr:hypothetical protein SAMN04490248_1811 [Salinihabitans flavidus]
MSEAKALQGQFLGWRPGDRDAKLNRLSHIVRHFNPLSFEFSISCKAYREELKDFSPRGLNPHFYCVHGILGTVSRFLESRGAIHPVKFIFDSQDGVDADIAIFFEFLRSSLPRGAQKLISGLPAFENDRNLLPLQASDFLAWHIRREHEGTLSDTTIIDRLRTDHVVARLEVSHLKTWRHEFSKMPGLERMQSKSEWQRTRTALVQGKVAGYIPPYGTRWKNFKGKIRDRFKDVKRSFIRRRFK